MDDAQTIASLQAALAEANGYSRICGALAKALASRLPNDVVGDVMNSQLRAWPQGNPPHSEFVTSAIVMDERRRLSDLLIGHIDKQIQRYTISPATIEYLCDLQQLLPELFEIEPR